MRAPFQTLIILYKECGKEILYGVFLRKKEKFGNLFQEEEKMMNLQMKLL